MACRLPERCVLSMMAFLMFVVTQMIRSNLYIAIVVIVDTQNSGENNNETYQLQHKIWQENYKGVVLGAFYWCYWITELPGGLLAQHFGAKKVLGYGVMAAGFTNFILPASFQIHPLLSAVIRAFQGLCLGVTWPAMHCLSAKWIPRTERSKFMSTYHGAAIGTAITYPISGVVIASFGWEYVFYLTGAITLMWSIMWWLLIYDNPGKHPRISKNELNYLCREIEDSSKNTKRALKTPWRAILTSTPFWAVLVASQGIIWGSITLSMQMPTYFHEVHHLNIKTNGLLLGIPDLCKFIFGVMFSFLMDFTLKSGRLTITSVRKISILICELVPATLLIVLGKYGCDSSLNAIIILSISLAVGGASSSGNLANIVDISPNFAGTILGLVKTLCVIPGVISPLIVNSLLMNNNDVNESWFYVFLITSGIYSITCIMYLFFGSGEIQAWNKEDTIAENHKIELQTFLSHAQETKNVKKYIYKRFYGPSISVVIRT